MKTAEMLGVYAQRIMALERALRRIVEHEVRADRRHRGMVDVEEVETLRRIARLALADTVRREDPHPMSGHYGPDGVGR